MRAPPAERKPGVARLFADLRDEWARGPIDLPGDTSFSLRRSHAFQRHTLQMLLDGHQRYGPIFVYRVVQRRVVALIGPEANHFVTVSGAENFSWRQGMFGEQLIPLIGDGLITTDDAYHDRARRIVMPAFHRRRMDVAVGVMSDEAERGLREWRAGTVVDVYAWIRAVAMRIALRALLGLDPWAGGVGREAAEAFERALSWYDTDVWLMLLRGPGTPWARMQAARRALDRILLAEIGRRGVIEGERDDAFSMLVEARDENGDGFSPRELRDQITTLLFGGHDTTSSTLSFLMYELGRHPHVLARVVDELERVLPGGRAPGCGDLADDLPYLSMAIDETLRLYPPVWFGPRMTVREFKFGGYRVPVGQHVIHSSWVSHHLPDVFPNPEAFIPERFSPQARRELAPGAYIPFGGGSRICIGKRFGQLVVKAVAVAILQRFVCEPAAGYQLRISKAPTLSPDGGLPMLIRRRN